MILKAVQEAEVVIPSTPSHLHGCRPIQGINVESVISNNSKLKWRNTRAQCQAGKNPQNRAKGSSQTENAAVMSEDRNGERSTSIQSQDAKDKMEMHSGPAHGLAGSFRSSLKVSAGQQKQEMENRNCSA